MKTENRFSPSPAAWRNQATLRHPERSTYRCFLTDLAGFIDVCRAGPDYAKRQDRKKTGLFHSSLSSYSTLKRVNLVYADATLSGTPSFYSHIAVSSYGSTTLQTSISSGTETLYSWSREMSRKIFAYQQAIFLFDFRWNLAAVGQDGSCQGVRTLAGIGTTIGGYFLSHAA